MLEFSPENFIRSTARPIIIPVYVINNGKNPVTIIDVRVSTTNINYITIHYEKIQVPSGPHHLTKIADVTIYPHLVPSDIKRVRGSIQIYTLSSINQEPILQIPFRATVLHGSVDYDKAASYFYIPSSLIDSSNDNREECRGIKLHNRFNTTMVIYNITTDKTELLSQYIRLKILSPYVYASPGQTIFPVCISVIKSSVLPVPLNNLEASLTLHTNLSYFHLPLYLYNGLLSHQVVVDSTNGGIRRNDSNPSEYFIASIPVNSSRTVRFVLQNANPVDIPIEKISFTLPKSTLQVIQMQAINGSETNVMYKSVYRNGNIIETVIPAHHHAIFSLTINGTSDPSFYNEMITFKTRHQTVNIHLKYRIISGSVFLENKKPIYIDVFPNRVGMASITLHNGFDEPTDVTRMEFPTYGNCFSFIWNTTSHNRLIIEANKSYQIGKLAFDMLPLCNSIQIPSESTCYCGLNNHPEFKKRWEQHVSALNTEELDEILVTKFRNLWKEWTSLVRKQKIQTNIWLITDQAEVTCPVTIGFVWPSVLEFMTSAVSRTPVIIDYHLTLLNTTKAHNIVVTNPSSNMIQYSIELISSYDNKKIRNKRNSVPNQHAFDITTTSKRVELSNEIYKFNLLPNEQLTFTASYRPKHSMKHEVYFVIRNNLTIIESILLRGEGGSGSLTVGNRKAGSSDIPLVLEMNEKQYKLCSNYHSTDSSRGNPILLKVVTLRNTGNIRAIIHDISFGHSKCSGQGFSVHSCSEIEIEPNERYDLQIRFQPDYTLTEIAETLTLNTNIGVMTFPLIVRIPQRVLATCYQTIPRPAWEIQIYYLCLFTFFVVLFYIVVVALYEARRLYNDYLARIELRCRHGSVNERVFSLNDMTEAAQSEQNIRERTESRTSVTTVNTKKDPMKDDNKTKENDIKPKRSQVSTNGTKDNGETSSKVPRTSDGSNTTVRPVATSPKAIAHKHRRVTTENGPVIKSSKQQPETPLKPQPLKVQKSPNTEQAPVITPPSITPPSTTPSASITDEENEPFVLARSKRVPGKTKESTTNVTTVKSTPITNGITPYQTTPPSPPPPPPPSIPLVTGISRPTARSDLSEQKQHQQDMSRSTDSLNDQQWYMVGSNRNIRKGATATTHRREITDEPSTTATAKTNKTTSNNSDFGRYVPQTEQSSEEPSISSEWIPPPPPPPIALSPSSSTTASVSEIPSLMSISTTPQQIISTTSSLKITIPSSIINEEIEPLPFPQHAPGPIQRPNKLAYLPIPSQSISSYATESLHSPETPDVLDQINRLLDHQNNVSTTTITTPTVSVPAPSVVNTTTVPINDLTSPNIPWTTFSSTEWPPKYESSWPLTNIQHPTVSITTQVQNPFAFMSPINEAPRSTQREDSSVWSSALGTATPRPLGTSIRTQRVSTWNDIFSSTVPSATDLTKSNNYSWSKAWPTPDPPSTDIAVPNGHETMNPFWSLNTLSNEPTGSSVAPPQQVPSTPWWPNASSDENNNKSQTNHLNDDPTKNRDQSRWDFAR